MKRLPDKPSELILLALADLERVEAQPETYTVDMGYWHHANSHCSVCFAGAVMAKSLGLEPNEGGWPEMFEGDTRFKLEALDKFRTGRVVGGLVRMNQAVPTGLLDGLGCDGGFGAPDAFPRYRLEREQWWQHMLDIVGILQAEGL